MHARVCSTTPVVMRTQLGLPCRPICRGREPDARRGRPRPAGHPAEIHQNEVGVARPVTHVETVQRGIELGLRCPDLPDVPLVVRGIIERSSERRDGAGIEAERRQDRRIGASARRRADEGADPQSGEPICLGKGPADENVGMSRQMRHGRSASHRRSRRTLRRRTPSRRVLPVQSERSVERDRASGRIVWGRDEDQPRVQASMPPSTEPSGNSKLSPVETSTTRPPAESAHAGYMSNAGTITIGFGNRVSGASQRGDRDAKNGLVESVRQENLIRRRRRSGRRRRESPRRSRDSRRPARA